MNNKSWKLLNFGCFKGSKNILCPPFLRNLVQININCLTAPVYWSCMLNNSKDHQIQIHCNSPVPVLEAHLSEEGATEQWLLEAYLVFKSSTISCWIASRVKSLINMNSWNYFFKPIFIIMQNIPLQRQKAHHIPKSTSSH